MPTVLPPTRPASASRCSTQVKTARCVSTSIRRRVRDTVEWSGGAASSASSSCRRLSESAAPRNRTFRVQPLEVAEQQHPEVAPTRPTDPVGIELGALLLDEGVEARRVENTIQAFVKRMARARGRSELDTHIDGCRPRRRRLPIAMEESVVRQIDPVDPYTGLSPQAASGDPCAPRRLAGPRRARLARRSHIVEYAPSSRLVSRAPDRSRCDAGFCHRLLVTEHGQFPKNGRESGVGAQSSDLRGNDDEVRHGPQKSVG